MSDSASPLSIPQPQLPAQAVLFDIGNVLLKFDFNRAARAMAAHCEKSVEEIRTALDGWQHRHETGTVTSDDFGTALRAEIGYTGAESLFREQFCDIFTPNEPMWEFARSLFGKVPVYLFSNISLWHETWVFEKYPDFVRFDGGFYSWRLLAMKPDPAFYKAAVEALPFPPGRIAYMDDMPLNVEGGRAAGFQCWQYSADEHPAFLAHAAGWGI
ncbi:MAG: HAD-superfamily hydrolase, subfamily variant 3 [Verrucomicrobiales bacterium]|nr:HAD-superfamily hydrolase, subfamily variant 3 [Verrucomicrobiales bacterium]